MDNNKKKMVRLSASRLSTLNSCSWIYFCQYILKIKSPSNSGSSRGTIAHAVFEYLLKNRRKPLVEKILQAKTIKCYPPLEKYVALYIEKEGLTEFDKKGEHNFNLIDEMIQVGLSLDFYCEGWELEPPELEFKYKNDNYELLGYIDKSATKPGDYFIRDFKSSASKYEGEEKEYNIQSLIYSLWSYKERGVIPFVQFIFLRFKDDPYIEKRYSKQELDGFSEYLTYITQYLSNFTFEKAISGLAAEKGFPKDGGFKGRVMCGRAKFPGDLKKNGELAYFCPHKFPYTYHAVFDNSGEYIYSSREKPDLKDGENIVEQEYKGCWYFNKQNYQKEMNNS